jgi:hypothetical protein
METICIKCSTPGRTYSTFYQHNQDYQIAESQWLYGFE